MPFLRMIMNEEIKPEISIAEGVEDGHPVRYYLQDDVCHSATYLEPALRNELIFPYMKKWNLMFELDMEIRDVLMIGGAGYSYPKYIISHKPAVAMTVAELDETAVQRARDWFFLDELMTKYQTEETGRLRLVTADGRQLLADEEKQYDVIINDAYSGFMPAFPLATAECARLIRQRLKPGGLYMANVPGYDDIGESWFLQDVLLTLQNVFRYVLLVPAKGVPEEESDASNYIVFASDTHASVPEMIPYETPEGRRMYDKDLEKIFREFRL